MFFYKRRPDLWIKKRMDLKDPRSIGLFGKFFLFKRYISCLVLHCSTAKGLNQSLAPPLFMINILDIIQINSSFWQLILFNMLGPAPIPIGYTFCILSLRKARANRKNHVEKKITIRLDEVFFWTACITTIAATCSSPKHRWPCSC